MSDHHARHVSDDVYDHELEEPGSGRRRRQVADWGVGDDVFDHMPRNRFSRTAEGPPRERRFSGRDTDRHLRPADPDLESEAARDDVAAEAAPDDRRFAPRDEDEAPAPQPRYVRRDEDFAERDPEQARRRQPEPPAEGMPRGGADDGRRTIVIGKPEDVPSEIAAITADRDLGDVEAPEPPALEAAAPERRTVKIGGRPEGSLEAARAHRDRPRRPPRTAGERIGARPDRLAMWAFALGLLLIAIAILSAM